MIPLFTLDLHFLEALWYLILCGTVGRLIFQCFKFNLNSAETPLFEVLAGYPAQAYLIWFLGRAGGCGPETLLWIYAAQSLILAPWIWKFLHTTYRQWKPEPDPDTGHDTWWRNGYWLFIFTLMAIIVVEQLISAHAPPTWRDDLSYHLYLPKAYLEMGQIQPPPLIQRQSFYHQIFNMSYLPLMAAGGEMAAKMLNTAWQLILVMLVYFIGKRAKIPSAALAAALCVLYASPGLLFVSETTMTDLPAACYVLAGLLAYLHFESSQKQKIALLILTAYFSAFALNKYTEWSYFIATALLFAFRSRKEPLLVIKGIFAFGFFAFLFLLPLAYYLWIYTGNPIYPIPIFGLPTDTIEVAMQKFLQGSRSPLDYLAFIWNKHFGGANPSAAVFLALIPAIGLFPKLLKGTPGILLSWSLIGHVTRFMAVGSSALLFRYILPSYAVWMLLSGSIWQQVSNQGKWSKRVMQLFLGLSLIIPCLITSTFRSSGPLQFNLGTADKETFLNHFYPSESYPMVKAINQLPDSAKVAVLDHHFIPYYYKNLGASMWPVPAEIMALKIPESINEALKSNGVTHVLFIPSRWNIFKSGAGYKLYGIHFGPHLQCRWFMQNKELPFLKPIYTNKKSTLFKFLK